MAALTQKKAVILVPAEPDTEAEAKERRESLLAWFTQRGWILEAEAREDQSLTGRPLAKLSFWFRREAI